MSQIPTNRSTANSVTDHLADHNEIHRLHNIYDGTAPTDFTKALVPTTVKTINYSAAVGQLVPLDTTSGAISVTLPASPVNASVIGLKLVTVGGTNAVTVIASGGNVFNKAGGPTTISLFMPDQGVLLQYNSSTSIWYVISDDIPVEALDTRYSKNFTLKGDYNSGTTYSAFDLVASGGLTYASIVNSNTNHTPASSPTFWQIFGTGSQGPGGPPGLPGPIILPFGQVGAITVATGVLQVPMHTSFVITNCRARLATAPTGSSAIFDVKKNGTTIFSSGGTGSPLLITAGNHDSGNITSMTTTSLSAGDFLTVDIAQVGSTIAGSNLIVNIVLSGGGDVVTVNQVSTTTYTLQATDANTIIQFTNSAGCAVTVPNNATVPMAINSQIVLMPLGAGGLTLATPQSPAVIEQISGFSMAQFGMYNLFKVNTDLWNAA